MNIKLKIITIKLELLRSILHFLLNFKKPTNKLVVFCSQQLDEVIVVYHKVKYTLPKVTSPKANSPKVASPKLTLNNNRTLLNNTLSTFL